MAVKRNKMKADLRVAKYLRRKAELIAEIDETFLQIFKRLELELQAHMESINYINPSPLARLYDAIDGNANPNSWVATPADLAPIRAILKDYTKPMKVKKCNTYIMKSTDEDELVPERVLIEFALPGFISKILKHFGLKQFPRDDRSILGVDLQVTEDWPFKANGQLKFKVRREIFVKWPLVDRLDTADLEVFAKLTKEYFEDALTLAKFRPMP